MPKGKMIIDFGEDLHARLKAHCGQHGLYMRKYVTTVVEKSLKGEK